MKKSYLYLIPISALVLGGILLTTSTAHAESTFSSHFFSDDYAIEEKAYKKVVGSWSYQRKAAMLLKLIQENNCGEFNATFGEWVALDKQWLSQCNADPDIFINANINETTKMRTQLEQNLHNGTDQKVLEPVHAKLSERQKWLQFKKIFTCLFKKLPDSFK